MKDRLRKFIGSRPALFFPIYRVLRRSDASRYVVFDEQTELVIEGFPRCANTFAVLAFMQAQVEPVVIAHHLHQPAQIMRGVAYGVPTVVLIRQPEAAIRSLALRRPQASVLSLIRQYIDFYSSLLKIRNSFYLADFQQVTTDFGEVSQGINSQFGTSFSCFQHSEENVAEIFAKIDRINEFLGGNEHGNSRPRIERDAAPRYEFTGREMRLLEEAQALYLSLT